MRTFHSIYAVIVALGLKDVAEDYKPWGSWIWNNLQTGGQVVVFSLTHFQLPNKEQVSQVGMVALALLVGLNIINVAVRFLFVTEVLSKVLYELRAKYPLSTEQRQRQRSPNWNVLRPNTLEENHHSLVISNQYVTLFHYPAILLMGGLFYSLCESLKAVIQKPPVVSTDGLRNLLLIQSLLLILNSLWLLRINRVRKKKLDGKGYEVTWMRSNAICAVFVVSFCAVAGTVGLKTPQSWLILSSCVLVFFLNSILDLFLAATHYVPQE